MTRRQLFLILILLIFSFIAAPSAYGAGASLYFSPSAGNYKVGDLLPVDVLVNTEGKAINLVEAKINFPSELLEVISLNKTNSIFSLWVEEPKFSNKDGTVSFVGGLLTPGYNGSVGKIINIVFRIKNKGAATPLYIFLLLLEIIKWAIFCQLMF